MSIKGAPGEVADDWVEATTAALAEELGADAAAALMAVVRPVIPAGYDELNWFRRWRLSRKCRRRGWGLLVTSHRDIRIPTLIRTSVSRMQAITIVKELTEEWPVDWSVQAARQVDSLLEEHDGNMREVLFALYDRFDEFCRSEVGDIRVA